MGSEVVEGLVKALHTDREELMSQMEAAVAAAKTATAAVAASAQVGQHNSSSGSQRSGSSHYPPLNQAAAAAAAGSIGDACVPHSSSMSSLAGPSTSSVPLTVLKDRQQLLDTQQQLAARLKLLMAKKCMLMFTLVSGRALAVLRLALPLMQWIQRSQPTHHSLLVRDLYMLVRERVTCMSLFGFSTHGNIACLPACLSSLKVGFMVGCLTYDQICTVSVLAWPYSVR